MQARIEEVTEVDTLTLHECHGRYPQANSVEDFRRNLAAVPGLRRRLPAIGREQGAGSAAQMGSHG